MYQSTFPGIYNFGCRLFLERSDRVLAHIVEMTGSLKGKIVCEVGAGTGRMLGAFDKMSIAKYYFVEPKEQFIQYARSRNHNKKVVYVCTTGENIAEHISELVDVVLFVDSFHHIPNKGQLQSLQAAYSILKPHGFIVLVEFDASKLGGKAVKLVEGLCGEPATLHSAHALGILLEESGFKSIKVRQARAKLLPGIIECGKKPKQK